MSLKANLLVAAIAAASWTAVPTVLAQVEEPGQPSQPQDPANQMPPSQATPAEPAQTAPGAATANAPIDDKKIEQFADAYLAVQTIQQKAATDLQSTSDPAEADKVKATAESDMIAAVERTGLKVDEFNDIVQRMASDTEMRSRVAAKLQERSGGT